MQPSNLNVDKFSQAAQQMADRVMTRVPALLVGIVVFFVFYLLSIFVSRTILRTTRRHRPNLGVVFARLVGAATILVGFLAAFSVVAPSFQAGDLIKILGIGGVAIGFAFQNILQNFLAGLLLLFLVGFRDGVRRQETQPAKERTNLVDEINPIAASRPA